MVFKLSDLSAVLKFQKLPPDRVSYVKKRVALSAVSRLSRRSPVLTGRYRASFNCSVNGIDFSVAAPAPKEYVKEKKVFYQYDETKAQKQMQGVVLQVDDDIFISNSLPYAEALENGHSRQAPHGIFRTVIPEVKEDIKLYAKIAANKDGGLK